MLEILKEDYIRTARGKGLPETAVILKHGLSNAPGLRQHCTGIQLIQLVAGTVVVEQVFSLPGLGRLILSAVLLRDLPLVQGTIFVGAAIILAVNFLLDSLYPILDPRIRGCSNGGFKWGGSVLVIAMALLTLIGFFYTLTTPPR